MTDTGPIPGWLGAIVAVALGLLGGGGIGAIIAAISNRRSGERSADVAAFHEVSTVQASLIEEFRRLRADDEQRHQTQIDQFKADWQRRIDALVERLERCEEGRAQMREDIATLIHKRAYNTDPEDPAP